MRLDFPGDAQETDRNPRRKEILKGRPVAPRIGTPKSTAVEID
jgi:hypothetical protein